MKKKITTLLLAGILLCGCTKRTIVENKETKEKTQYVTNILCKPEGKELQKEYEKMRDNDNYNCDKLCDGSNYIISEDTNDDGKKVTNCVCNPGSDSEKVVKSEKKSDNVLLVDYDKLPQCKDLKITSGGYEGLWISIFVKPLAWVVIKIGNAVKNYGLAIIIVGLALRALMLPASLKSAKMSENMKSAQKDIDKLERKYRGKEDRDSMMMKSQEMMLIYKKYDINPLSSCLTAFLQLPIFFAFLEAVYRVPAFFEGNFLVFNLGTTPSQGIRAGNYWYILLIVIIIAATYYSFRNMNTATTDEFQAKQMKMTSTFMIVFIGIASFSLPTSIALYWVVSNVFTVVQNLIVKKGKL